MSTAQQPDIPITPQAREVLTWLEAEGYRPTVDPDGDLRIVMFGRRYLITQRADDSSHYVLAAQCIHRFDEEGRDQAMQLAQAVSMGTKVVKCMVPDAFVSVIAEGRYAEPAHFVAVFDQLLGAVDYGVRAYRDGLHEHAARQAAADLIRKAQERN